MKSKYLNNPSEMVSDFFKLENEFFLPGKVINYNPSKGLGKIEWLFHRFKNDWFFNKIDQHLELQSEKSAPLQDYDVHPQCDFEISFVTPKTIRLRIKTSTVNYPEKKSLMIAGEVSKDNSWKKQTSGNEIIYHSDKAGIAIDMEHFSIRILDKSDKQLTSTQTQNALKGMYSKAVPFCFIRRSSDYSRSIAASFSLSPDEKIFGCGESFTQLNKHGQQINLFCSDTQSTASSQMYKPIPFFISSRGYGIFVHTSTPLTFDFGKIHDSTTTLFVGDEELDLFFFIGTPKEILSEYTTLTGRSPLPPLWSFGLWMGTISFNSEKEVRDIATNFRKNKFPCDVIHIDAGWFTHGINCDFKFNKKTFPNPAQMMKYLRKNGFRTSLWQIPYFTPHNPLFREIVEKGLYIKNSAGHVPTEDAILDFSNNEAIKWYREKLEKLLKMGVSVIKADFGEAAPLNGLYASGLTGFYEHNLYPLRYNKIVSDLTFKKNNDRIIWARSAWAGSQRYPLHWGGDAEVSDAGMAGTLRGGLSFGLSGFTYWSHDIGGFSGSPVEDLYARWAFFGLLTSHSRIHGFPPREPWKYSKTFQHQFRKICELRYRLLPYIYSQAYLSSKNGWPLLRTLFFNYPDDPTVWFIEDEFLLGNDLLVAPLMEAETNKRKVYLPEGKWVNFETKEILNGGKWETIKAGKDLRGILLLRFGAAIPYTQKIYSTEEMDWAKIEWIACSDGSESVEGFLYSPEEKKENSITAVKDGRRWVVQSDNSGSEIVFRDFESFRI